MRVMSAPGVSSAGCHAVQNQRPSTLGMGTGLREGCIGEQEVIPVPKELNPLVTEASSKRPITEPNFIATAQEELSFMALS